MNPLLSICIPTYNHADLLSLLLYSLVPQVAKMKGRVEIIVIDNFSADNTNEIARQYANIPFFHYRRLPYNRGASANVVMPPCEFASGEYIWIIGDDDMVIQGRLPYIVNILHNHNEMDAFFVNIALELTSIRDQIIKKNNSVFYPKPVQCSTFDWQDRILDRWEDLFDYMDNKDDLFTRVVGHIIRRSVWCKYMHLIDLGENGIRGIAKDYSDLGHTYPHTVIVASAMMGKPAYLIGIPSILMGQNYITCYSNHITVLDIFRRKELIEFFRDLGVDSQKLVPYQELWLKNIGPHMMKFLYAQNVEGIDSISLDNFHAVLQSIEPSRLAWISVLQEFFRNFSYRKSHPQHQSIIEAWSGRPIINSSINKPHESSISTSEIAKATQELHRGGFAGENMQVEKDGVGNYLSDGCLLFECIHNTLMGKKLQLLQLEASKIFLIIYSGNILELEKLYNCIFKESATNSKAVILGFAGDEKRIERSFTQTNFEVWELINQQGHLDFSELKNKISKTCTSGLTMSCLTFFSNCSGYFQDNMVKLISSLGFNSFFFVNPCGEIRGVDNTQKWISSNRLLRQWMEWNWMKNDE